MSKGLLIAVISSLLTAALIGGISYFLLAKENQLAKENRLKIQYLEKYVGEVKLAQNDTIHLLKGFKSEIKDFQQTKIPPRQKNDINPLLAEIDEIKAVNEHILKALIESRLVFAKSHPKADLYSYSAKSKLNLMSNREILSLSAFLKAQNREINHLPDDTDLSDMKIRSGWYHYGTGKINYLIKKHDLSILDLKAYCQIAGLFI